MSVTHRNSLPFLIIEATLALISTALVYTVTDPVQQALMDSEMWNSSTTYGTQTLGWFGDSWHYVMLYILFVIMFHMLVHSRRGGR